MINLKHALLTTLVLLMLGSCDKGNDNAREPRDFNVTMTQLEILKKDSTETIPVAGLPVVGARVTTDQ